ncbi:hypothetical protein FACS1894199_00590 [Bacteroidia bacterium]|nr:hypothetical protein FACS1894199_00590 [Bacteroidia bacterium]
MCIVVLLASILTYIGLANIIVSCYHPDIEALKEAAKSIFLHGVNPEPVESMLFQLGVLSIPLLMLGFFFILTHTKLKNVKWENYFNQLSIGILLTVCIVLYCAYAAPNPHYGGGADNVNNNSPTRTDLHADTNFKFYFSHSILANQQDTLFLVVAAILGLMLFLKRFEKQLLETKKAQLIGIGLVSIYACFYFSAIWKMFVFDYPWSWENQYDLCPPFYPVTQVYAGTPNLTDGLNSNYGSFAWFLNPLFKMLGLSVKSFTTVMSVFIIITFGLFLTAMFRTMKSKLLVLLSWASVLFLCRLSLLLDDEKLHAVFSIFPIRQLVAATTMCLASFYVRNRSKILYFVTYIVLAFGIIWNPEFGMVCFAAWVLMLCYLEFDKSDWKKIMMASFKHIIVAVAALTVAFTFFSTSVYMDTGQFPDLKLQFISILFFGKYGFYTLPMSLVHPWNFVLLVYAIGLVYSIYALFDKKCLGPKSAFVLLLSIIGAGTFTYFQGRSHNVGLAVILGPALFLLGIFADTMWQKGKIKQIPIPFMVAISLIVIILSPSCVDLYENQKNWDKLAKPIPSKEEIKDKNRLDENTLLIKSVLSRTTEKVFIHTSVKYQALYFGQVGLKSAFNPSLIDLFSIEQQNQLVTTVLVDTFDVFVEPQYFYYPVHRQVNAATAATYSINTANNDMYYMKKRKYSTLTTPSLLAKNDSNTLLYEKFHDDTASLKRRTELAVTGIESVDWGTTLSAEVVFFSERQAYPNATLFSNYNDTINGIWCLQAYGSPDHYIFQWGKYSIPFIVEPNKWNYLAIEARGLLLELYLNGNLVQRYALPIPVSSSNKRLTVANRAGNNFHFTGAISEILLSKDILSAAEIRERWEKIQKN